MALDEAVLRDALIDLDPVEDFPAAAAQLAGAYGTYMKDAQAGAASMVPASIDSSAAPAMQAVLASEVGGLPSVSSISAFDLLLVKSLVDVVASFWAAMVAVPGTFLPGATVITPPTSYAGLAVALDAVLASNLATQASQTDAMTAIASTIHGLTVQQPAGSGTATFPGPVISPIL